MTEYFFDLEVDYPAEIIEGNLGDEFYIEFRLGYRFDSEEAILMSVGLVEGGSFLPGEKGLFDLRFGLRNRSIKHDWKVSPMDFSRSGVAAYVPSTERSKVLISLLKALPPLVARVEPRIITMSTFNSELPPPALVKYESISSCLCGIGYSVKNRYRSSDSRDRWHFVREACES